jgi:hypothetical protein
MPAGAQPAPNAGANSRTDGIVIGNLMDRGNWSLEIDDEVRRRNVEAAALFRRDANAAAGRAADAIGATTEPTESGQLLRRRRARIA